MANGPQLLVSVRNAEEAVIAMHAGADLIDIKEPMQGSLGKAEDQVIQEVVGRVKGIKPVSAAMGEWVEENYSWPDLGLTYCKWGLARTRGNQGWRTFLERQFAKRAVPRPVVVAYADWQCARAPEVEEIVDFACQTPDNVLLIDTHCKEADPGNLGRRPTLLDWVTLTWVLETCRRCREKQVRVALAGSLGLEEIELLKAARPDWFAVRGLVCQARDRTATLDATKITSLKKLLAN